MAIKFNKDALLKQRFWILLAVTACLALFGTFYLQYAVDADDVTKTIKTSLDGGKRVKATQSDATIKKLREKVALAQKSESIVWSDSYGKQEKLFKWAPQIEDRFKFLNGKFATEIKITSNKAADAKDWPKDTPNTLYGVFVDIYEDYIQIKNGRKEIVEIFRMDPDTMKITSEENKPVNWTELKSHKNKQLAVTFQNGKYFGDGLTKNEQDLFKDTYREQIHAILKSVDPLDEKGNGIVQLKNWLYRGDKLPDESTEANKDSFKFVRYVSMEWDPAKNVSKEAWMAQEDLWIQQEIFRIIKEANDDISAFKPEGDEHKEKKKGWGEKKDKAYSFKNSYFAVELTLDKDQNLAFKIRNLMPRRQKLDLSFRVLMNKAEGSAPEVIRISGLPLMPAGAKGDSFSQNNPRDNKQADRQGIYSVEQVLTWETAAVKRIDQITIGSNDPAEIAHSHRTYPLGLRPFDEKDMDKAAELNKGRPDGPPMNREQPGRGGPMGGGPMGGGAGANKTPTFHGLWTDRYVEVSDQSRRLPVAVALIVDQDHVNRVITAFNNSKLRFLESQVLLNHYPGSLQPPLPDEKKDPAAGSGRPFQFRGREGPMGPMGPRGGPGPEQPAAGASDMETNMEMVVYGIMTLYQRYPPRPAAEKKQ
jgi:hypothetical protein